MAEKIKYALENDFETLTIDNLDLISVITLNRPMAANAFNKMMVRELYSLFEDLAITDSRTRCLVVTGAGKRSFCAGGDLKERNQMSDEQWFSLHLHYERLLRAILQCPIPIIGAINGAAFGGGCELAASFDFSFCVPESQFALPEATLGIIPGLGGTQLLPRKIGQSKALQLTLTGSPIDAYTAKSWGLINDIFPREELLPKTLGVAKKIASNAPVSVKKAKLAITQGANMPLDSALHFEIECYNQTVRTHDRLEGVAAFNEKRQPKFMGH